MVSNVPKIWKLHASNKLNLHENSRFCRYKEGSPVMHRVSSIHLFVLGLVEHNITTAHFYHEKNKHKYSIKILGNNR